MKVGIDIDGVVRDWAGKLLEVLKRHNIEIYEDNFKNYDISTWTELNGKIFNLAFDEHAKEIYTEALLIDYYTPNFIAECKKNDIETYFATHQKSHLLKRYTLDWLHMCGLSADGIIFVNDPLNKNFTDVLIDDCTENLDNFNGFKICYNQLWNQDFDGCRVNNLREAFQIIKDLNYDN